MFRFKFGVWLAMSLLLFGMFCPLPAIAQDPAGIPNRDLEDLASNAQRAAGGAAPDATEPSPGINFFDLLIRGGIFMIPIAAVSIVVVMFAIERAYQLRRSKILPRGLVKGLGQLARDAEVLEPRAAYKLCQQFPSAAANIIRSMLLKVGRPHSEVEAAIAASSQREADRLYGNVRWLNLAGGIAPLLGLLGTVWGLILAFHDSTQLGASQNRAEQLARGIYEALVTTLAGLLVAIPAVMLSHYFEGKLGDLFRQIEELMFHLSAQVERYEGRVRFDPAGKELMTRGNNDPLRPQEEPGIADDIVASVATARPLKSSMPNPAPTSRPSQRRDA